MNVLKFLNASSAVSLHLHHSLDKILSIFILFFLKNNPIVFDCSMPFWFKLRCVEQSFILKFEGSPFPGAIACRIKISFPPSFNEFKICSSENNGLVKIEIKKAKYSSFLIYFY